MIGQAVMACSIISYIEYWTDCLAQPLESQTDNQTSIDCVVDPVNQQRHTQSHQSLSHSHTHLHNLGSALLSLDACPSVH